jgi:hypothetical protein
MEYFRVVALLLLACFVFVSDVEAHKLVGRVAIHKYEKTTEGRGLALVNTPQTVLNYHKGPLLTGPGPIPVYLIFYGTFTKAQKHTIRGFFASFGSTGPSSKPSVRSWWSLTAGYNDTTGATVAPSFALKSELSFSSKAKNVLLDHDIELIVVRALKKFPADPKSVYVVLTADDVQEENFCLNSCASHFASNKTLTSGQSLPYIWAGNPGKQCPGLCAWPFAKPAYGPPNFTPLSPPNNDVGIDGLIINLGSMLAGTATNPFDTGYYQGDATAPLEAATACTGAYGPGAYPGNPGTLLTDKLKRSFNVYGSYKREFLLPALWNPYNSQCTTPI